MPRTPQIVLIPIQPTDQKYIQSVGLEPGFERCICSRCLKPIAFHDKMVKVTDKRRSRTHGVWVYHAPCVGRTEGGSFTLSGG